MNGVGGPVTLGAFEARNVFNDWDFGDCGHSRKGGKRRRNKKYLFNDFTCFARTLSGGSLSLVLASGLGTMIRSPGL
jgi:hypothetical protein